MFFAFAPLAAGAFNSNGVETFDGSQLDLATWHATNRWTDTTIVQNNSLTVNSVGNPAQNLAPEYVSRYAVIGIGGSASVDLVTPATTPGWSSRGYFGLSTNSYSWPLSGETYSLFVETWYPAGSTSTNFVAMQGIGNGQGGGTANGIAITSLPPMGTLRTVEIERLTSTLVRYSVFDESSNLIASRDLTVPTGPEWLYITMGTAGTSVTFDNVHLGGNYVLPEPATGFTTALVTLGLLRRRHGRRRHG